MTPLVLSLNLSLNFLAMAALCMSMKRHQSAILRTKPEPGRTVQLRVAGWCGLLVSLVAAILLDGWNFGPVQWIGAITGAALIVSLLLSYTPRYILPAALLAVPLTVFLAVRI